MRTAIFILIPLFITSGGLFTGCGLYDLPDESDLKTVKNYTPGITKSINFGSVMISFQKVYFYQNKPYPRVAEEILYSGVDGKVIKLQYRELYRDGYPKDFTQDLTYDLAASDIIVFRNYQIKVIEADNSKMSFIVLKD